ncbi:hypothetical protein GRI89_01235 [Altererythrobacter salegens]|uniref:HNH domain-containing protein n=1 Tax=Croceibacterium salegens TaxID=1737568 RepID=A0A6I4SRF2_9SPHN|nr:HNH endonuclease [Croceibacterium salegens]MXO58169.1 hypothetical protein [Croceibacterium salegens]
MLTDNAANWQKLVDENPTYTNKYRYRHDEIKNRLHEETGEKCIYCEAKMRPVAPSNIEHIIPVSYDPSKRFVWDNLTIACPECNRLKGAVYDEFQKFINPYSDDVEALLLHRGPMVGWQAGQADAELTVKYLRLDSGERTTLMMRKIEAISDIDDKVERYTQHKGTPLGDVIAARIRKRTEKGEEFSAMIRSILSQAGLNELIA